MRHKCIKELRFEADTIPVGAVVDGDERDDFASKAYGFEIKKDFCRAFHEQIEPLAAQERMAI